MNPGHSPPELNAIGLRATLPRLRILRVFRESERRHLSAEDVYRALLLQGADIGMATVYRVLMQFVQAGLLMRQTFEGDKAVFELDEGRHHDHLVCLRCGRVVEFVDAGIEQRQHEIAQAHGFTLQAHALSLYGLCGLCGDPACRDRGAAPQRRADLHERTGPHGLPPAAAQPTSGTKA